MARATRRKRDRSEAPRQPNILWLIGATATAVPVGALFWLLAGYEAGLVTLLFGLMAIPVAFFAGLYFFAYFATPLEGNRAWSEGFSLLQAHLLGTLKGQANLPTAVSSSFKQVGAGVIPSHQTLAISRNNAFTRATDPGFVRLQGGERIVEVVDLRMQRRVQIVKAITRDGIPITTAVSILFQVQPDRTPDEPNVPYPVERDAVFRVAYSGSVDDATSLLLWHSRICRQIAADLVAEISLRTLDELYQNGESNTLSAMRQKLEAHFYERFREAFAFQSADDCPIKLHRISIGELLPPPQVNEQRIRDWQTDWECRIREDEAEAESHILRETKNDHRFAQMEITRSLLENLEEIRRVSKDADELTETVKLHVVETLESVMGEKQDHRISDHMMHALAQALTWLQPPGGES